MAEQFAEEWEITDSDGNAVNISDLIVDGQIDLSSIEGSGTITVQMEQPSISTQSNQ